MASNAKRKADARRRIEEAAKADLVPAFGALGRAFTNMPDAREAYLHAVSCFARSEWVTEPERTRCLQEMHSNLDKATALFRHDPDVDFHFGPHLAQELLNHLLKARSPDKEFRGRKIRRIFPNQRGVVTGYTEDGYPSIAYRGASAQERKGWENWEKWYTVAHLGEEVEDQPGPKAETQEEARQRLRAAIKTLTEERRKVSRNALSEALFLSVDGVDKLQQRAGWSRKDLERVWNEYELLRLRR